MPELRTCHFQLVLTVDKLSTPVFCSRPLMHYQTVFNTYKLTDFTALRFALPWVRQVKGNFVLILAPASNHLSVSTPVS